MAPVTPGSVLYNSVHGSWPNIHCMLSSARSSWTYLHMDTTTSPTSTTPASTVFQQHIVSITTRDENMNPVTVVPEGDSDTLVENRRSGTSNEFGEHSPVLVKDPNANCYAEIHADLNETESDCSEDRKSACAASSTISSVSTPSPLGTISSIGWHSGTGTLSSASSSSSGRSQSVHSDNRMFTLVCDTAGQLWRDNPERDMFNTFSVSEQDLTCAIAHLETQLGARMPPTVPEVEEIRLNEGEGENSGETPVPGQLPSRIQFVLDSYCNIFWSRKQDLRELKLLQKQENKQYQDLISKNQLASESQERKFEMDMQNLVKNYEQEMDTLTKQQKQAVEKHELNQQHDMKTTGKRIKTDQEKELKMFREKQKQEMKLLKQELDMMPKNDQKKENVRKARETKEIELQEKERVFLETQAERLEKHMRQLADQHRQKIAMLERQFLQQKQQLLRTQEAAVWEMEKEQLHEKHQLAKGQLKDMFFLKRHQMLTRHQKELDQMKRYNSTKEEEMQARHSLEKRRLPKILKAEAKTRALMFKQSLRLSTVGTPDDDKTRIKQFEENEKKRMKAEQQRQEAKHKKQWDELVHKNESSLRELEQLQAEKRKLLMEQETQKIKELDEQYANNFNDWKAMLVPRKQKLEEEFFRQKEEQEKFYGASQEGEGDGGNVTHHLYSQSSSTSLRSKDSSGSVSSRHSTVI